MTSARKVIATSVLLGSLFLQAYFPAAFALDSKQVDLKLAKDLDNIQKLLDSGDSDNLSSANKVLLKYIKSVSLQKDVMNDPLKKASDKGLTALSSDDKKVRCYSWDTLTGGTMHFFYSLIVYDSGSGKLRCEVQNPSDASADEDDPGATFENVDTIKTKDGKTVYLVRDLFIGSGMDHGRNIQAYVIANGKLTKYKFFQAGKKLLDTISFAFANYDEGTEFELTQDKKTLKVPNIKGPGPNDVGSGTPTGKYLNYFFDGTKFVFRK